MTESGRTRAVARPEAHDHGGRRHHDRDRDDHPQRRTAHHSRRCYDAGCRCPGRGSTPPVSVLWGGARPDDRAGRADERRVFAELGGRRMAELTVLDGVDAARAAVGTHLGYSDWLEIT